MNLIEQQSLLRGMPDDALKQAVSSPSNIPPYLVLTEIQRRKTARDRFSAMDQRQRAANTVAEELVGGSIPPGMATGPSAGIEAAMAGGMQPPAPMGLEAAMPASQPEQTNFAKGGMVGYADGQQVTLQDILAKLSGYGVDQEKAKQDAITMAMLQASAAMLSNGSSNTFRNIGAGIGAAAPAYQQAMKDARGDELALLSAQANVLGDISATDRAEQDRLLRLQELNQQALYQQGVLENQMLTDEARRVEYAKTLPEEEQERFVLEPQIQAAQKDYNDTLNSYLRTIPDIFQGETRQKAIAEAKASAAAAIRSVYDDRVLQYLPAFASDGAGAGEEIIDLSVQ